MPLNYKFSWPLEWPDDYEVTRQPVTSSFTVTQAVARDEMLRELGLLGASSVVITTNLPVNKQGQVVTRMKATGSEGVAVYFSRRGNEYVIACDRFNDVWDNMRAVGLSVEAIRRLERYGTRQLLEKALGGLLALPPAPATRSWWQVLGLPAAEVAEEVIKAAYRTLAKRYHPEGTEPDADKFREVHQAYEEGLNQLST